METTKYRKKVLKITESEVKVFCKFLILFLNFESLGSPHFGQMVSASGWGFTGSSGYRHQALQNRLACMKEIIEPWLDQELNDDEIRILMKKSFSNYLKIWSFLTMMIDFSLS